jgi:hypothetical protein
LNRDHLPDAKGPPLGLLEWITAVALVLVIGVLGWIIVAATDPAFAQAGSVDGQVIVILVLLLTTLVLVSVLALLQTRT